MDFTSKQETDSNSEDDNVEKFFEKVPYSEDHVESFFELVPYCEESLSYEYRSDNNWNTDSDIDDQTSMDSSTDFNEKDDKDDLYKIKKTPMKSKKQSGDYFSNISIKRNTVIPNKHVTAMDCDDIVKTPDKIGNMSKFSPSFKPPKRLSYSPQKFARVYRNSASARTSLSPKNNEIRRHSDNYIGINKPIQIQDFRVRNFSKKDQKESVPLYKDYQLIGDSQLLRFAEQILNMRNNVVYPSLDNGKNRRIGYCVSGQNINGLKRTLLENEYKIHEKVIVLIGTNDMLQRTSINAMIESFEEVLDILKKFANRIVLLTVPPVPKIHSKIILKTLKEFNKYLLGKANGETIFSIDLSSHYIGYDNTVMNDYYESIFFDGRPDLIHLNKKGFKYLRDILDINYFDDLN